MTVRPTRSSRFCPSGACEVTSGFTSAATPILSCSARAGQLRLATLRVARTIPCDLRATLQSCDTLRIVRMGTSRSLLVLAHLRLSTQHVIRWQPSGTAEHDLKHESFHEATED